MSIRYSAMDKDIRFTPKKVDSSWKETISKSTAKASADQVEDAAKKKEKPQTSPESQKRFLNFLMGIATQALYMMGAVEGGPEKDLDGAKEMIDILQCIHERTQGNLSNEEEKAFEKLLYDLQMKFVETTESESTPPPPPPGS